MKKIIWYAIIILCVFCACTRKENYEKIDETETGTDATSQLESTGYTLSYFTNFFEYVLDETTGQYKYGRFLGENIKYRGEDTNLAVGLSIDMGKSDYKDISMLCIMLLDGQLIPFSMSDENKQLVNYITQENGREVKYHLDFTPYGINMEEEKELIFAAIPFYDNEKVEIYENGVLYHSKKIISESEEISRDEYKEGARYVFDEVENMYGKPIWEISEYNGEISDYIIQKDDGKIYYMADYMDGEFVTFLFCDGKLFSGFDGEYYLKWNENSQSYLNKEIDVSSLDEGQHNLFAVTVDITEDNILFGVNKSMNKEVIINE